MQAVAIDSEHGPAIRFRLTNVSAQPLKIYPFQLPWGNANAVEVGAITLEGKLLSAGWPIDDPGPETPVTVAPGSSLSGDFLLGGRFNDLEEARKQSEVLVTWCYPFTALGEVKAHKITGAVVVKRRAV